MQSNAHELVSWVSHLKWSIFFPPKPDVESKKLRKKEISTTFDAGIRKLIRDSRKDEALKAYQVFTDTSEDDARIEIERLEWEETASKRLEAA